MERGKEVCRILKDIRRQIAQENGIEYITSECTHKGDCAGTCPKCEAEVRYLERCLAQQHTAGRMVRLAGVSLGLAAVAPALTSCTKGDQVDMGDVEAPVYAQLGADLVFDLISKEDFLAVFLTGGWAEAEIYDVYPDGSLGTEILSNIDGYAPQCFAAKDPGTLKMYLSSNADPDYFRYRMTAFDYEPAANQLIYGNRNLTVASIDEDYMVCYGPVFSQQWAPEAFVGKYVFRHVDDATVAAWDRKYAQPAEE